jgi:hypothetical protein
MLLRSLITTLLKARSKQSEPDPFQPPSPLRPSRQPAQRRAGKAWHRGGASFVVEISAVEGLQRLGPARTDSE